MPYEVDLAIEKYREGEREVRYTIIRIIRDHIHRELSTPTVWRGCDFDFTNATFDGGDFGVAEFTGKVSFRVAKFIDDGMVSFDGAEFIGGEVSFDGAMFPGGLVFFEGAKFTGGEIS